MKLGWVRPLVVLVSAGLPASVVTAAFAFQGSAEVIHHVRGDTAKEVLASLKMAPVVLADAAKTLQKYDLRGFIGGVKIRAVRDITNVRLQDSDGELIVELPIPKSGDATSSVIEDLKTGLSRMHVPMICTHSSTRIEETAGHRATVCSECGRILHIVYK